MNWSPAPKKRHKCTKPSESLRKAWAITDAIALVKLADKSPFGDYEARLNVRNRISRERRKGN